MNFPFLILSFIIAWVVLYFVIGILLLHKMSRKVFYTLVTVVALLVGCFIGYLGRTELRQGDYAHKNCDEMLCDEASSYKFNYNFKTEYYCEEHSDFCRILTGEIESKPVNSKEDDFGHDKFDVWTAAVDVVEGRLKSPSTAEFCKISDATITKSENTWTIEGYVDAQNSFGATLRNDFIVKITFTSSTKYTIEQCSIS